jgi:DMSO/TMAO reductase YedYZ molybdopterin-dependent catalytic subunit
MPTRREVLAAVPVAATAVAADRPGLTVRMAEPANLEAAFADQTGPLTPTDQFFVRSHFAVPAIDPATYTLEVTGAVETPLKLTLDQLKALPAVTRPITLECAGNGRVFLTPATRGLQWQFGAVGTAEWTGVPLSTILEKARPRAGAAEVILVGADRGSVADPATPGVIAFDRGIPMEKALRPEVMLAWGMNGQPLTPAHGFPVRAVVGGWYGMAAVKWVTKIVVSVLPYDGFWQTFDYSYWERRDGGLATLRPVAAMQPKAQVARPQTGERVPPGGTYTVRGYAWAGEQAVGRVEVSTDGGKTWQPATPVGEAKPFCWQEWTFAWPVPAAAGPAKVLARCVDAAGKPQADKRDPDRRTYMITHPIAVDVLVR